MLTVTSHNQQDKRQINQVREAIASCCHCQRCIVSLICVSIPIHVGYSRTVMFTCCRDGVYKGNYRPRKTLQTRKRKCSRKLSYDAYCLSSITATECLQSGTVRVKYVATHTNHSLSLKELKHLPIPMSVRTKVKTMLANGVQMEKVLDGMCGTHH